MIVFCKQTKRRIPAWQTLCFLQLKDFFLLLSRFRVLISITLPELARSKSQFHAHEKNKKLYRYRSYHFWHDGKTKVWKPTTTRNGVVEAQYLRSPSFDVEHGHYIETFLDRFVCHSEWSNSWGNTGEPEVPMSRHQWCIQSLYFVDSTNRATHKVQQSCISTGVWGR